VAGRLELTAIDPDAEPIIFDPTNVPAGVELPPDDEILALRRLVYGHSYAQRTG
jgi:catalase